MPLLILPHWRIRFGLIQTWFRSRVAGKRRPIDQIRASWGQELSKDPWLSTMLFDLTRSAAKESVDDRTNLDGLGVRALVLERGFDVDPFGQPVSLPQKRPVAEA